MLKTGFTNKDLINITVNNEKMIEKIKKKDLNLDQRLPEASWKIKEF
jgi:hypothetical protein